MSLTKVTSGGIKDGTITNEDISASTSISQSKLSSGADVSGSASGLMTPTHKSKLDSIEVSATANQDAPKVFHQNTAPTSGFSVGDIWYDDDDDIISIAGNISGTPQWIGV